MKKLFLTLCFFVAFLFLISSAYAEQVPELKQSHRVYGVVNYNNEPIGKGNIVAAYINGKEVAGTATDKDGKYGYKPLLKVIGNDGDLIEFYVNGNKVSTLVFKSNSAAELGLTAVDSASSCPDKVCEGYESKASCPRDCGVHFEVEEEEDKFVLKHQAIERIRINKKNRIKEDIEEQIELKIREDLDKGNIIVNNAGLEPDETKSVIIDNLDPGVDSVCIKDIENIEDVDEITASCDGASEYLINCNNITKNGYRCENLGEEYEVYGLKHSAVIELEPPATPSPTPSGGASGGGGGSSGGGGGGGGGGGSSGSSICTESWSCASWSSCSNGMQTRTCTDQRRCGTTRNKPIESKICAEEIAKPSPGKESTASKPEEEKETIQELREEKPKITEAPEAKKPRLYNWLPIGLAALLLLSMFGYIMFERERAEPKPELRQHLEMHGVHKPTMNFESLRNYMEEMLHEGYNENQIKQSLLRSGWPLAQINFVFDRAVLAREKMEQIEQYIHIMLSKGYSKEQIKESLVKSGWKEQQIDGILSKI